jgi:copper chaperone NosL
MKKMNSDKINPGKMTAVMKAVTIFCSLMIFAVLFFPIWKIELTAPQYPEGLVLKIWADRLDGNVDVINGLNHYIGMRHLHTEDFLEFIVLPWIIKIFAGLGLVILLFNRKKFFTAWFFLFVIICIISMIDFYRWEYDYGHELNPDAPIKVPGMAYQPPLIGYKKLLNFGAYSIPDYGGWLFVVVGVTLLVTWLMTIRADKKFKTI